MIIRLDQPKFEFNLNKNIPEYNIEMIILNNEEECILCLSNKTKYYILHNQKNHLICTDCFDNLKYKSCPFCRKMLIIRQ